MAQDVDRLDLGLEGETCYVRDPHVLWRHTAGSLLLLRPGTTRVVVLGDTACPLWWLLDEPTTFADLVHVLADAYQVPCDVVAPDVAAALQELTAFGLVAPGGTGARARQVEAS